MNWLQTIGAGAGGVHGYNAGSVLSSVLPDLGGDPVVAKLEGMYAKGIGGNTPAAIRDAVRWAASERDFDPELTESKLNVGNTPPLLFAALHWALEEARLRSPSWLDEFRAFRERMEWVPYIVVGAGLLGAVGGVALLALGAAGYFGGSLGVGNLFGGALVGEAARRSA